MIKDDVLRCLQRAEKAGYLDLALELHNVTKKQYSNELVNKNIQETVRSARY